MKQSTGIIIKNNPKNDGAILVDDAKEGTAAK
jgi:hypothetical protein